MNRTTAFHSTHLAAVAVLVGLLAAPAGAQDGAGSSTLEVAAAPAQIQTAPQQQLTSRQPYWASIGGFEADTNDTGYGFFGPQYTKPVRDNVSVIAGANANYLYYDYATAEGRTNVRSPGLNVQGGVLVGDRNWWAVTAGPSFKRRHIEVRDPSDNVMRTEKDWHTGFNVGTSVWVDPTTHNNVFGMLNYDTVDKYTWGRIAFKEQVGNRSWQGRVTPYLGVEYIGQGNPDIRSNQVGGFLELTHVPSTISVMFRAGYKVSEYDFGPDKTGPWFAIGFYQRLR